MLSDIMLSDIMLSDIMLSDIMLSDIMLSVIKLHGMPALYWLSSYITSHCWAAAPQSGAKQIFYCTLYYITLYSNCEAQRASKNLKKCRREG